MKSAFIILARCKNHTFYSAVRNARWESFPARRRGNKQSISDTSGWAGIILSRIHESTSNLRRVLRSQVQPVFFALGNRLLREMQNRGEHHICEPSSKSELCGSLPSARLVKWSKIKTPNSSDAAPRQRRGWNTWATCWCNVWAS